MLRAFGIEASPLGWRTAHHELARWNANHHRTLRAFLEFSFDGIRSLRRGYDAKRFADKNASQKRVRNSKDHRWRNCLVGATSRPKLSYCGTLVIASAENLHDVCRITSSRDDRAIWDGRPLHRLAARAGWLSLVE